MSVRKCPKCASVWYTELVKCAFCGVEGEEVKGPISPAKLNLAHGSVSPKPQVESTGSEPPPPPAVPEVPRPEPKEAPSDEPAPAQVESPALPPTPPPVKEAPPPIPRAATRPERASTPRLISRSDSATMPAPPIPSAITPLIFAGLGVLACAVLPGITALRHHRVWEILAMLSFAVLSPFAPFGWLAGQRYADQCRVLGFVPAPASRTGKILGMLATFLLVFEVSALSIFVVVQGLSGKVVCPLWK